MNRLSFWNNNWRSRVDSGLPLQRVCAALAKLPCARDNCIGVGALSRHRRWWGLGAFVCDGMGRETVEGRGAVSGSLAGMFPARRRALVPKVRSGRTAHPICPWKSTLSTTILVRGPFVGGLDHFGERQALVEQR